MVAWPKGGIVGVTLVLDIVQSRRHAYTPTPYGKPWITNEFNCFIFVCHLWRSFVEIAFGFEYTIACPFQQVLCMFPKMDIVSYLVDATPAKWNEDTKNSPLYYNHTSINPTGWHTYEEMMKLCPWRFKQREIILLYTHIMNLKLRMEFEED